jgi:hypothetical protein
MHIKEYVHLEEIKDKLEQIQHLFYDSLKVCESHHMLGQLYQYVVDIIESTQEVEIE